MLVSADMGRPKKYNYPANMTYNRAHERFVVRNPVTTKSKTFTDEAEARKAVEALNDWLTTQRAIDALMAGRPKIKGLVEKWITDRLQFMPWSPRTRQNHLAKMRRIGRELGERTIAHTDCMYLDEWMGRFCKKADTWNDWRYMFVLLWDLAVFRKLADANEGEKIIERSTSKKLEVNRKDRLPLELVDFQEVHRRAPAWLQVAMEQSLVTLQARQEICDMQHAHYRNGFLFVIRDKSSSDSDMAFIKIAVTEQLEEIRSRSRALDNTVSPFIVHRKPDRMRRDLIENKPHWTYVTPDYLTKGFAAARDGIPRFSSMPEKQRPSFHEVRGLGSRIYQDQGMSEAAIQSLMTHANKRTTQIYLDGGAQALTDDDYQSVVAPLVLRDVLG